MSDHADILAAGLATTGSATKPTLDPATRAALEALYAALCSAVVLVARALGRESPLRTREERRHGGC